MVGLLNALYAYQGVYKSPTQLAEEASTIEMDVLRKPIGRQDQFATALGGLNLIEFLPNGGGVRVEPLVCPPRTLERLQRSMLFFFLGTKRSSNDLLLEQARGIADGRSIAALTTMRDLAYELRAQLASGDHDIGALLHRNWELKRTLAEGVTTEGVDSWYERAISAGATGGKLLGAGGGGFLLVVSPPERHAIVRSALAELREVPVRFAARGTQILFATRARIDDLGCCDAPETSRRSSRRPLAGKPRGAGRSSLSRIPERQASLHRRQRRQLVDRESHSRRPGEEHDRPEHEALQDLSLNENAAIVTALANDLGYESVFVEQLVNLIRAGDVLIVVSASGNSPNVLKAMRYARRQSAEVVGLLGFSGGEAAKLADVAVIVPSDDYGIVEDVHLIINHILVDHFKARLEELAPGSFESSVSRPRRDAERSAVTSRVRHHG